MSSYVPLWCKSNFSFLEGASHPDELIEDTREFVRNSPGIALAGAAVVGFVVARLVKSGLGSKRDSDR